MRQEGKINIYNERCIVVKEGNIKKKIEWAESIN